MANVPVAHGTTDRYVLTRFRLSGTDDDDDADDDDVDAILCNGWLGWLSWLVKMLHYARSLHVCVCVFCL